MDPTVTAPTLGGLGGLPPPGVDEVVTTGYAGGPLGVALPPPASSDLGLGALGPPNDPPVPPGAVACPGGWADHRADTNKCYKVLDTPSTAEVLARQEEVEHAFHRYRSHNFENTFFLASVACISFMR